MRQLVFALILFPFACLGGQQIINTGTVSGDGTGDTVRIIGTKANLNFAELYSLIATIGGTNPILSRSFLQIDTPISVRWYGAKGDGITDDTAAISNAVTAAASAGKSVTLPAGKYLLTGPIVLASGQSISGASSGGTTILANGNFRVITAWGTTNSYLTNVYVGNLTISCSNGGNNQVGVSIQYATDSLIENVSTLNAGINGYERLNCQRVTWRKCSVNKTVAGFGLFSYKCTDCISYDAYATNTALWSWEYKDCKRCADYDTKIDWPNDYGYYVFTGYDANLIPGDLLCEDNVSVNLHINAGPNTKSMIEVYGSPRMTFISPVLKQYPGSWVPVEASSSTFYNETGSPITGNATSGSTNITSCSNASAFTAGDRIHMGGVTGNYTVYGVSGTTVQLTSALAGSYTAGQIGWVGLADELRIINLDLTCAGNSDGVNIASPSGDSYKGVIIDGGQIRWAGVNGIRLTGNADVTVSRTKIEGSTNNAVLVDGSRVQLDSITAKDGHSDSILLQNGSHVSASNCTVTNSASVGVYCLTGADTLNWSGGKIESCATAAAILAGNSSITGALIRNSRWSTAFYRGQVWVNSGSNVVTGCVFDPGSGSVDSHIEEQSSATGNQYLANSYIGNLGTPVNYAAGSSSKNLALDGGLNDYRPVVVRTSNQQILSSERGTEFSNEGAVGLITHSLPPAAPGLHYGFSVRSAVGWQVGTSGVNTIRDAGNLSSAGGYITSTTLGDYIHLTAINTNEWWVTQERGSGWTTH